MIKYNNRLIVDYKNKQVRFFTSHFPLTKKLPKTLVPYTTKQYLKGTWIREQWGVLAAKEDILQEKRDQRATKLEDDFIKKLSAKKYTKLREILFKTEGVEELVRILEFNKLINKFVKIQLSYFRPHLTWIKSQIRLIAEYNTAKARLKKLEDQKPFAEFLDGVDYHEPLYPLSALIAERGALQHRIEYLRLYNTGKISYKDLPDHIHHLANVFIKNIKSKLNENDNS